MHAKVEKMHGPIEKGRFLNEWRRKIAITKSPSWVCYPSRNITHESNGEAIGLQTLARYQMNSPRRSREHDKVDQNLVSFCNPKQDFRAWSLFHPDVVKSYWSAVSYSEEVYKKIKEDRRLLTVRANRKEPEMQLWEVPNWGFPKRAHLYAGVTFL